MTRASFSILIASTDAHIREMGRLAVQEEGYRAILCGDGEEALESARNAGIQEGPLRLLVLEAFLPKSDGFEVARELEEAPEIKSVPVLMLIDPKGSQKKRSLPSETPRIRLGADDYLQKPFDAKEIRGHIHSMTKHFRARRASHPVTNLPGHPDLEQELLNRLARGEVSEMVCLDINHFRPFNDHYGTEKGNAVIQRVARIAQEILDGSSFPKESTFFAHVDGDDFILLVPPGKSNALRQQLRQQFQSQVPQFYSQEDVQKGFFYEKDRQGRDQIFPLMSLSTAVLEITVEKFSHYGEIVSEMNELLRQSKVGSQDAH